MSGISRRAFLRITALGALAGAIRPRLSFAITPASEITGLVNPHGLCALDNQTIAIAESGSYCVKVIKIAEPSELVLSIGKAGSSDGELNFPAGVSLDSGKNFVVCDTNNGRVCVFDKSGQLVKIFGSLGGAADNLFAPHSAKLYKDKLYVANTRSHWITVFDYATTRAIAVFGEFGDDSDNPIQQGYKFRMPQDVWVDDDGIFVLDSRHSRIVILDHDGNYKRLVKLDAAQPTSFARTREGWAITDFSGKRVIFANADFSKFYDKTFDFRPWGVVELDENLWISDPNGGRVIKILR